MRAPPALDKLQSLRLHGKLICSSITYTAAFV